MTQVLEPPARPVARAPPAPPTTAPSTPATRARRRRVPWTAALTVGTLAFVLFVSLADLGFFEDDRLVRGLANLPEFLGEFVPPDTSPDTLADLGAALVETLQMAFVGTILGAAAGLPLAVLAARTLVPPWLARATRVGLAFVRTVPSLLWALVFVVLFGLGPLAGVLGLAVYTLGYVGKLYYEAFEGLDPDVLEAVRATGANRLAVVRHAAVPEAANSLLSNLLFAFEYNVRASAILGFVGAGGIGFYVFRYFEVLQYPKLTTAVLLLLATVLAIDAASRFARKRWLLAGDATR